MTNITRLQAENYKRIKAVDITAEAAHIVPITGRNAQGKSSILDAITAAIGGAKYTPTRPVRAGEEGAAIRIELSNGMVVRRIFDEESGAGGKVVVESGGFRASSPQEVLNKLFSSVAFDPVAFTRLEPKKQLEQLRGLVKFDVDLEVIAQVRKAAFDTRTDTSRELRRLEAEYLQAPHYPDAPAETVELDPLIKRINDAAAHNGEIEQRKARREAVAERIRIHDYDIGEFEKQLLLIQANIDAVKGHRAEDQKLLDEAPPLPEPIDVSEATAQLQAAGATNEMVKANQRRQATALALQGTAAKVADLTTTIQKADRDRAEAFEKAEMPVPGLSFGEGEVLFNGVPLDQASAAEQLRVSAAIGIATSPDLRVMLIRDASLLDDEGYALLVQMAVEHDFQFWVETVDHGEGVGIIIEDGGVKDAPTPEPIEKPKRRVKPKEGTLPAEVLKGATLTTLSPDAQAAIDAERAKHFAAEAVAATGGGVHETEEMREAMDAPVRPAQADEPAEASPEPETKDEATAAAVDALLATAAAAPIPNFAGFHVEQGRPATPSLFDDEDD